MTTSYTSLLGLALPVTGELQGTWGDTVNSYITQYLDAAVAGTQTISGSQTAVTLSVTTGSSLSQAGSGATGSSQYQIINCTGNPASLLTITVPAASKVYLVLNSTSTSQSVKIVGTGPTTGVTIISGEKALVAWNGSDFVKVATAGGSSTFSNVTVTGTTTLSGLTASTALALDASKNVVSVTNTGTGNNVLSASPTLTGTVAGASLTLSSLTSGRVTYAGASGLLQDSANLTFDGTTLTAANITSSGTWTFSGGTANGVLYLNGSKVATSGSALTFDGSQFYVNGGAGGVPLSLNANTGGNTNILFNEGGVAKWYLRNIASDGGFSFYNVNAGSEGMRLTSTGLGVGTSSPVTKFEVSGSAAAARVSGTAGSVPQLQLSSSGVVNWSLRSNNDGGSDFTIYQDSTQRLKIDSSGNLGIGTSSPVSRLQVGNGTGLQQAGVYGGGYDLILGASGGAIFGFASQAISTVFNTASVPLGIGTNASQPLIFGTVGTEKMRLDSSGNLGLGVTPSAWGLGKAFEIGIAGNCVWGVQSADLRLGANMRYDGSNYRYVNNGVAARYDVANGTLGGHAWYTAPSGTAGNAISFTQAMTLDGSGNLGIGTSSPAYKLDVNGVTRLGAGTPAILAGVGGAFAGGQGELYTIGTNTMGIGTTGAAALRLYTNSVLQATIDSSGNLGIGTSSPNILSWNKAETLNTASGNAAYELAIGGSAQAYFAADTTNVYLAAYANKPLLVRTNNATVATFDTSGNLGIGTSSPGYKLDIVGGATVIRLKNQNATDNTAIRFAGNASNADLYLIGTNVGSNGTGANFQFYDLVAAATRLTIDSSGNLTLGNAAAGVNRIFNINGVVNKASRIAFQESGVDRWLIGNGAASESGNFEIYDATNGNNFVLTRSGNLGLGVTPSANWATGTRALQIGSGTALWNPGSGTQSWLLANAYYDQTDNRFEYLNAGSAGAYAIVGNSHQWHISSGATGAGNPTSFTQAMTLDASGNLLVGTTSTGLTNSNSITLEAPGGAQVINHPNGTATGAYYVIFGYNAGLIGSITQNGTTAVAYNTSSDYRLKDNPQPLTGSGAFIDALQPKTWNWKADGSKGVGFIAHEVQEVSPGSVVGEKDGEQMQAMEYGSAEFIANIIAELQSLRKRVAELEAK